MKNKLKNSFLNYLSVIIGCCLVVFSAFAAHAIEIKEVTSPKGIKLWLVEDQSVPLVALQFSWVGGTTQDPEGKEGLVNLMSGLFEEGAGDLKSLEYQAKLDDIGADIAFDANRDKISGSLRVLEQNRDEAINFLKLALDKPRFDQDAIDRIREQIVTSIKGSERDPMTIGQNKFNAMLYGKHPYSRRGEGTIDSLAKINRDDIIAAHKNILARDNLKIGLVGPINEQQAGELVDKLFGDLPEKATLIEIPDAQLQLGGMTNVNYDLPQTTLALVYPGIKRSDKDFFAAYLMNDILGGSGLTSRLFAEVRDKRGLAYGVSSNLVNYDHAAALTISTATRAEKAEESLKTIRNEIKNLVENNITADELKNAKSFVVGSYAVNNLSSSSSIASVLVGLQQENLPIDYIEKRADLINGVTLDDVHEVAKKIFKDEPALLVVGPMKN
ncbi:insulinase family protein [Bartonella sp. HY329]|uniref:M16 family metallopeptidase n=1 Tax=unclassified Bartonella TaxID=2645622 RepID=UPI0021C5A080|nr:MULTISPECIES: pitrilysin family protein [unclassified Bartonella]UXM94877.1 insulinase family protein [Bartonella sp. HY329]UXN09200.1 insulinase family protein [Bartonella sp. HY328]